MRSASSKANSSYGETIIFTPAGSGLFPSAAILIFASVSGTCLMQTSIFMAAYASCRVKSSDAFVPPKPNELLSAARIGIRRAVLGTQSRSHDGSGVS